MPDLKSEPPRQPGWCGGKKILFVITKSNWGGAQAYVYTLATHFFKNEGARVAVALGGIGEAEARAGLLAERLAAADVRTLFVKSFMRDISIVRELKTLVELTRIFKNEKPDVVHLNSSKAGGIGALAGRLAGIPKIIFTSHGLAYDEDRPVFARALIWLGTWATILLAHMTIVISNDTYRRARRLPFCKNRVRLIYNGMPEIDFADRDKARITLVGEPIRKDILWIGTIAEFTRNKGLLYLIEAASVLKERGLEFRLVLIGGGEDLKKIKDIAIQRGLYNNLGSSACVSFPGFVGDAARWMKAFAIVVLPSLKEGLPSVLLEAGQAGCAVIGTNIPGITDIIDDSTGVLVEPKNPVALANALEHLLRDPVYREQLGRNLRMRVQKKFSVDRMIDEVRALYSV